MKRICVDQDQVLADILSVWIDRYNYDYLDNLSVADITDWDIHKFVVPKCGMKIYDYLNDPDLFESLPVIEHSQEVLEELSKKYEIFVCTAPWNEENVAPKYRWLRKHFPFINEDNYIFTRNKSILKADFLIDDKPENLECFDGYKIIFDAPHNQREKRFHRFNNWIDIGSWFSNRFK